MSSTNLLLGIHRVSPFHVQAKKTATALQGYYGLSCPYVFPGHRSRAVEGILRPLSRRSALAYSALHLLRPEYIPILSAAGVSA